MSRDLNETTLALRAALAPLLDGRQGHVYARQDTKTVTVNLTPEAARALVEHLRSTR